MQQRQFLVVRLNESIVMEPRTIQDLVGSANGTLQSTRQGGGGLIKRPRLAISPSRRTVVVDMREFRSALPFHVCISLVHRIWVMLSPLNSMNCCSTLWCQFSLLKVRV